MAPHPHLADLDDVPGIRVAAQVADPWDGE
jgi:hypothetical protein